ncbi:MAG: RNB domain-containing ribonuclease [Acidimicrobiia bacterium]|nr:RNB domain-containing ribonuclease [Acidimicrobiia bacterium]
MPHVVLRAPDVFETAFGGIRAELDVPLRFPTEVLEEAERATPDPSVDRIDARHLPLIAIDPPGATDLDQAFTAERTDDGYRVFYAIADVGAFVTPGGAVDIEARRRGTTLYSPDVRAPLHPPILSEDRSSLLPDRDRPALLWTIDLDAEGRAATWNLTRAVVRVAEAISYRVAQERIDRATDEPGTAHENLMLLSTIGDLRRQREAERGGVSLRLPAQEIVKRHDGYALEFDQPLPVEGWNAQISLLTGMIAGRTMTDAGVGILRTLPPADPADVEVLRRIADVLDLGWPADTDYAAFVRSLEPSTAARNAFLVQCTRLFKGAGYHGFTGRRPDNREHSALEHSAIASLYAHVTAPLRRLVDRFGNEILLAVLADNEPPSWAVEALEELPSLMGRARQRESSLERALLDMAEVLTLENHVGEVFDSVVVDVSPPRDQATVQITEPAVVTRLPVGSLELAERVKLRLTATDREQRTVTFEPIRNRQAST